MGRTLGSGNQESRASKAATGKASAVMNMGFDEKVTTMLKWHDLELTSCKIGQRLWAGYGWIAEVTALPETEQSRQHMLEKFGPPPIQGTEYSFILKLISPPPMDAAQTNEGHLRKILSYEVEQYFYTKLAPLLPSDVAVAGCVASTADMEGREGADMFEGTTATIMIDLRERYPKIAEKRGALLPKQAFAALDWLAKFHGTSWSWIPESLDGFVLPPLEESRRRLAGEPANRKVWLNGGYTYLATRRDEYADLQRDSESEWSASLCSPFTDCSASSVAEVVADFLTPRGRPFETYIHGDVKSENLFTTEDQTRAAFFDFQYIGLGLGVCDLAKLFTCSIWLPMLSGQNDIGDIPDELAMGSGEEELLKKYHETLLVVEGAKPYEWGDFVRHWETALVDWCRFQASWGFWGNTEWLQARVRSILKDQGWRDWLKNEVSRI